MLQNITFSKQTIQKQSFGHSIPGVKPPDYDLLRDFKRIRNLPDITCASCGIETTKKGNVEQYKTIIANAADDTLIKALQDSMPYMNSTAKKVAKKIIVLAKNNEAADIKDLMKMLIRGRKEPFYTDQNKKLVEKLHKYTTNKMQRKLPRDVGVLVLNSYQLSNKKNHTYEKTQENKSMAFLRDALMQKLQYAAHKYSNHKELMNLILKIRSDVQKLPSYFNSQDAFIVRCESLKKQEIAELFFNAQLGTVEHIVPRSEGGDNYHGNLLVFCNQCNIDRDCLDYADLPYRNPVFIPSLKKYLNIVKEHLRLGHLKGLEQYPQQVTDKLREVSRGHIDIAA